MANKIPENVREKLFHDPFAAFKLAEEMLVRSIFAVHDHLKLLPEYDLSGWDVDKRAINENVINGVTYRGNEVQLLIRPADGGYIKFH